MFKTELHCHSTDISECARVGVNEIIEAYTKCKYNTLVLTNHFNYGTMIYNKATDWNDFIDKYFEAYEKLKNAAFGKLNILIGAELRFKENINDYLIYGFTKEFLKSNPDIFDLGPERFHTLAKENGVLFIQAHPFRNGMTVINPRHLDGVEVYNGHFGHDSRNNIANMWAEKFSLIKTSGTDFHYEESPTCAGILTDEEITSIEQLISVLKSGKYELVRDIKE